MIHVLASYKNNHCRCAVDDKHQYIFFNFFSFRKPPVGHCLEGIICNINSTTTYYTYYTNNSHFKDQFILLIVFWVRIKVKETRKKNENIMTLVFKNSYSVHYTKIASKQGTRVLH